MTRIIIIQFFKEYAVISGIVIFLIVNLLFLARIISTIFHLQPKLTTSLNTGNESSMNKKVDDHKLPSLFVDGDSIKRRDTNETITLKGVTTNLFRWEHYPRKNNINTFYDRMSIVKQWNINIIGFILNQDVTLENLAILDEIVKWSKNNGWYIYLIPVAEDPQTNTSVKKQLRSFGKLMGILAERYKNETHIILGLCAEPKALSWSEWLEAAIGIAKIIRVINPNVPLLMSGIEYGRDFAGLIEKPFPFDNVLYYVSDYAWPDQEEAKNHLNYISEPKAWEWMIGKYPLFIGEFGGMWKEDFGTNVDLAYIKSILNIIRKHSLSFTIYTIDKQGELSVFESNGNSLTRKGLVVKQFLDSYTAIHLNL